MKQREDKGPRNLCTNSERRREVLKMLSLDKIPNGVANETPK